MLSLYESVRTERSVVNQRMDVIALEALAASEEVELDDEEEPHDDAAEILYELDLRASRTAGRKDVVENDHPCTGRHGVAVHLEAVGAVLQRIRRLDRLSWQLPWLARSDEACVECVRERSAEDEPARLGAKDQLGLPRTSPARELVDRFCEVVGIREQRH